jgi:hypothetical protein
LARHVTEIRAKRGGHVVTIITKPLDDDTILNSYMKNGYVRWKRWHKRPGPGETRILLWPDVRKANGNAAHIKAIQRSIIDPAFDAMMAEGKRTVQVDEGLYFTSPSFLGKADDLAMAHAIGRSGNLTLVTCAQRPSNLPLILYGSASHAFIGRTREATDTKRLSELGAKEGSKVLASRIADLDMHEFLWVPVAPGWDAEVVDLSK